MGIQKVMALGHANLVVFSVGFGVYGFLIPGNLLQLSSRTLGVAAPVWV
ncbi:MULTISPECIES: hypothetical protein [Kamptonema]|nr:MULTISPECIES: hypothetical protein [Kamptonema]CBN56698.1 hypothetical protein OSCI_3150002 [Kamptonema sp. PCC 6506]